MLVGSCLSWKRGLYMYCRNARTHRRTHTHARTCHFSLSLFSLSLSLSLTHTFLPHTHFPLSLSLSLSLSLCLSLSLSQLSPSFTLSYLCLPILTHVALGSPSPKNAKRTRCSHLAHLPNSLLFFSSTCTHFAFHRFRRARSPCALERSGPNNWQ